MFSALKLCDKLFGLPQTVSKYKLLALKKSTTSMHNLPLKVTICGAAGKVGQTLSLLFKLSPHINELCLYDLRPTIDMAMDLNEIDTDCKIIGTRGRCDAKLAFNNTSILVVIAANKGWRRLETEEMFELNRDVICDVAELYAKYCPKALLAVATNPVNTIIPVVSEQLKMLEAYDPKKVFGLTSLNQVRANKHTAVLQGLLAECVKIKCVGGGYENTIIPILSHAKPCADLYQEEIENIIEYVQRHRKYVPSITAGQSISRFVNSLLRAMNGENNVIDSAFVRSHVRKGVRYMCNPLLLGPQGIEKNLGLPAMTVTERRHLEKTLELLKCDIKMAETYLGIDHDVEPKKFQMSSTIRRKRLPTCSHDLECC